MMQALYELDISQCFSDIGVMTKNQPQKGDFCMKLAEIKKFAKQKKKEFREKNNKIKKTVRQQNQDRKIYKVLLEKYLYDARYCGI